MIAGVIDPDAPLLTRLRTETHAEHTALDNALDLTGHALTIDRYRRTLERFYGYYRPLEASLDTVSGWAERGLDLAERRKTPLLAADLLALGVGPELPRSCDDVPRIDSLAAAFGIVYVIEGASLGGQLISRHIRQTLGVTLETGGLFFHGYGERTGVMWKGFRAAAVSFVTTPDEEALAIAAALQTFRTLRDWCTPVSTS